MVMTDSSMSGEDLRNNGVTGHKLHHCLSRYRLRSEAKDDRYGNGDHGQNRCRREANDVEAIHLRSCFPKMERTNERQRSRNGLARLGRAVGPFRLSSHPRGRLPGIATEFSEVGECIMVFLWRTAAAVATAGLLAACAQSGPSSLVPSSTQNHLLFCRCRCSLLLFFADRHSLLFCLLLDLLLLHR